MDQILQTLRASWQTKHDEANKITSNPTASAELLQKADKLFDERDKIGEQITDRAATLERVEALRGRDTAGKSWMSAPQRTMPFGGGKPTDRSGYVYADRFEAGPSEVDRKRLSGGFESLGHFCFAQIKAGRNNDGEPSAIQQNKDWIELNRKSPTGNYEVSDPDGGLLIPPQFSNQIYERMVAMNQILQHLQPIPLTGNQMTLPALKEDSRADGSRGGGVLGYWPAEAAQYTDSHPTFRKIELKLHKLTVLTPVTEELINDSPIAMQAYVSRMATKEINFKINDAVINGLGDGIPLGILNSNSKITVGAVSGQGAGTFIYQNVLSMYARIAAGQRSSLVWLYNQDVEPQLLQLYMPTGTAAGVAIFTPNQANNGFNLMGRPAIIMEQCQSLGTAGDVIAFATDGYACITKGGIESFVSLHLRFDYDEAVFKWRFRMDGQPYDDVALTPYKGSNTVSSIVVLNSTRT